MKCNYCGKTMFCTRTEQVSDRESKMVGWFECNCDKFRETSIQTLKPLQNPTQPPESTKIPEMWLRRGRR